ncbi:MULTISPECIES: McrC family protein [unclassified Arsukibacterium]|uniref:McrC family protein n=1 Tax=unclassified Arsukibacterium TaxID=2635278 RepID=UPI000C634C32|nr:MULTISPECIES: McrC family protein [unclassified Arsukibacterium]MAA92923.1 restriction endonuclease [Rheinheimera sp.]MBM34988.1 restriction endonuclease [Rheinheimera sp.]HAW93259.1 restriction endonuclease [Candidatus Azambacteria bacterium]|tara:strand:- start:999 stop:2276 length:1278 start_codon:yes stop_codon:yes gene_type:complete
MIQSKVNNVTVREFGLLINGGDFSNIDCHSIPKSAFDWLMVNGIGNGDSQLDLVKVKRHGRALALQVLNYVGVLETPCFTRIEVLPKTSTDSSDTVSGRKVLLKMLASVEGLKLQEFQQSHLQLLQQPLYELLISHFLHAVAKLVRQGIRNEYQRVERESPFLKGQLHVSKQIRQRPGRQHYFHVSHDVYSPDRAENRLLHSALKQVLKWSSSNANQRLARELLFVFHDIKESSNFALDFRAWKDDRSIAHYRPLKPWCELILSYQSPIAMVGNYKGLSFLFPMEQLFERYVAKQLARKLPAGFRLRSQVANLSLVTHRDEKWFKLKPDIVVYDQARVVTVMDTKWKLLDQNQDNTKQKYNLSQADMYQLFAYGEKYLQGKGELYLIYPRHHMLSVPLPCFEYHASLKLHVVPYDLVTDICSINL